MLTTQNTQRASAVLLAAGIAVTLAACNSANSSTTMTPTPPTSAAPAEGTSSEHNQQDIDFAAAVIPHHEQAIVMSQMVDSHSSSEELRALADRIEAAQAPEIELMSGWLSQWGAPSPDSGVGMGMHDGHGGMMSDDQMADLGNAAGMTFDRMWLAMMIEHHEGAIEMAQTQLVNGESPAALRLAQSIITSQAAEINEMKTMLTQ